MDPQNTTYSPNNYATPQQSPSASPEPAQFSDRPKKVGPIIAIAVAILIIIAVAVYMYSSRVNVVSPNSDQANNGANLNPVANEQKPAQATETPATIAPVTNTQDDVDSLKKDLDSSINGLDSTSI